MAKRHTRGNDGSDDNESDYKDCGYDSADSDAYCEPALKKAKSSGTKARPRTTKAQKSTNKSDDRGSSTTKAVNTTPHPRSRHVIDSATAESAAKALLDWYGKVHATRGMPWRKPYNAAWTDVEKGQRAYEVWVSEIMLQQTQVATVIPYYNRWMEKFPTLKDLGESSLDTVHALWKGLGYYSRATRILEGAKKTLANRKLNGCLPTSAAKLQSDVPGIGRYSAGAIASIAYGEPAPVLDGNVNRLLSRVLALYAQPKAKSTLDVLWDAATALVEASVARSSPGDLNQSLIELGSTVCKPTEPACGSCPLKTWCGAYALSQSPPSSLYLDGSTSTQKNLDDIPDIEEIPASCILCEPLPSAMKPTSFPMKVEKKKAREETDAVYVIEWRCRSGDTQDKSERWFALVKRPPGGLLAGLEEFPTDANVGQPSTQDSVELLAYNAATRLLAVPLGESFQPGITPTGHSASKSSKIKSGSKANSAKALQTTNSLAEVASSDITQPHVVHAMDAGTVLHVFSHIRKTYRLNWIVLEGGGTSGSPPALKPRWETLQTTVIAAKPKTGVKGRGKKKDPDGEDDDVVILPPSPVRWVRMEEVEGANIGTGVVKMWKQVCALWEN